MYLKERPQLKISAFSMLLRDLLKADAAEGAQPSLGSTFRSGTFSLGGRNYSFSLCHRDTLIGLYSILFEWEDKAGKLSERVFLEERKSNLGQSVYFSFVCPHTHTPCRILYTTTAGHLVARKGLKNAHYRCSYEKRLKGKNRVEFMLSMLHECLKLEEKSPYREGMKIYSRKGKLTPYGKRVQRYEAQVETLIKATRSRQIAPEP